MKPTDNLINLWTESILSGWKNMPPPEPTKQKIGSEAGVKKTLSALNKCCARRMTAMAAKYAQALINSGHAQMALTSLAWNSCLDLSQTPDNKAVLVELLLMATEPGLNLPMNDRLNYAVHLLCTKPCPRDHVNRNLYLASLLDDEVSEAALDHVAAAGNDLILLGGIAKDISSVASMRFDGAVPTYKEQAFAGVLRRYLMGWRKPGYETFTPPKDWFYEHISPSHIDYDLLVMSHRVGSPLYSFDHFGTPHGKVEWFPRKDLTYADYPPAEDKPPHPKFEYMQGIGEPWVLVGGVPDFTFDSTTEEGRTAIRAMRKDPKIKALFTKHPKCTEAGQRNTMYLILNRLDQQNASIMQTSQLRQDFVNGMRTVMFVRWGLFQTAQGMVEPTYEQVRQFSQVLAMVMDDLSLGYLHGAVNKTLKL